MFKPKIGICTECKHNTEIWTEYKDTCAACFNKPPNTSKFKIDDVPVVRIIEDLLMERPVVKKIIETTMVEHGTHRIIRLEEDGFIYKVDPEWYEQIKRVETRTENAPRIGGVRPADPELIPKLNNLIDEHIGNCNYCQTIIEEE